MTRHLFRTTDELFRPNDKDDIAREEPISLKKLRKGDAAWSTKKVILGWAEEFIGGAEEMPCHLSSFFCPSLGYTNEIIEVYLDVC